MSAIENDAEEQFRQRLEALKAQEENEYKYTSESIGTSSESSFSTETEPINVITHNEVEEDDIEDNTKASKSFWERINKTIKDFLDSDD